MASQVAGQVAGVPWLLPLDSPGHTMESDRENIMPTDHLETGALKSQLATERRLRQREEATVADQDLYVANCTNELRIVHAAVSSLQLERSVVSRRLTERIAVVELGAPARQGARAAAAARREQALHEAATHARREHAALHEEATHKLGVLAAALADERTELVSARKELLHAQLLLLQTHAAIGTQIETAPQLAAIRDGMLGAAQRPLAATPTECLRLTRRAELVELGGAQAEGGGGADPSNPSNPSNPTPGVASVEEDELRWLVELAEEQRGGQLLDAQAQSALGLLQAHARSGTSLLLQAPAEERWATSEAERHRRQWERAGRERQAMERHAGEAVREVQGRLDRAEGAFEQGAARREVELLGAKLQRAEAQAAEDARQRGEAMAAAAAARAEATMARDALARSREEIGVCREQLVESGAQLAAQQLALTERHERQRWEAMEAMAATAELRQRLAVAEATVAELRLATTWMSGGAQPGAPQPGARPPPLHAWAELGAGGGGAPSDSSRGPSAPAAYAPPPAPVPAARAAAAGGGPATAASFSVPLASVVGPLGARPATSPACASQAPAGPPTVMLVRPDRSIAPASAAASAAAKAAASQMAAMGLFSPAGVAGGAVGPAWARGEAETPQGANRTGTGYAAAVYTPEQNARQEQQARAAAGGGAPAGGPRMAAGVTGPKVAAATVAAATVTAAAATVTVAAATAAPGAPIQGRRAPPLPPRPAAASGPLGSLPPLGTAKLPVLKLPAKLPEATLEATPEATAVQATPRAQVPHDSRCDSPVVVRVAPSPKARSQEAAASDAAAMQQATMQQEAMAEQAAADAARREAEAVAEAAKAAEEAEEAKAAAAARVAAKEAKEAEEAAVEARVAAAVEARVAEAAKAAATAEAAKAAKEAAEAAKAAKEAAVAAKVAKEAAAVEAAEAAVEAAKAEAAEAAQILEAAEAAKAAATAVEVARRAAAAASLQARTRGVAGRRRSAEMRAARDGPASPHARTEEYYMQRAKELRALRAANEADAQGGGAGGPGSHENSVTAIAAHEDDDLSIGSIDFESDNSLLGLDG